MGSGRISAAGFCLRRILLAIAEGVSRFSVTFTVNLVAVLLHPLNRGGGVWGVWSLEADKNRRRSEAFALRCAVVWLNW